MKNHIHILIIIISGLIFNVAMPLASVTAQNITPKNLQHSKNNK